PSVLLFPFTTLFRSIRNDIEDWARAVALRCRKRDYSTLFYSGPRLRVARHRRRLLRFHACAATLSSSIESESSECFGSGIHRRIDRKSTRLNSSHEW